MIFLKVFWWFPFIKGLKDRSVKPTELDEQLPQPISRRSTVKVTD
jgi:hypothetical protein